MLRTHTILVIRGHIDSFAGVISQSLWDHYSFSAEEALREEEMEYASGIMSEEEYGRSPHLQPTRTRWNCQVVNYTIVDRDDEEEFVIRDTGDIVSEVLNKICELRYKTIIVYAIEQGDNFLTHAIQDAVTKAKFPGIRVADVVVKGDPRHYCENPTSYHKWNKKYLYV